MTKKFTQLTEDTAPSSTDIIAETKDPAGTPLSRKVTYANVTKALSVMVGDSGAGGTKGLVPAPAAGDTAAGKFLKADGTFAVPSGGYSTVQDEGSSLTQRSTLDFVGGGVSVTDTGAKTQVSISGASGLTSFLPITSPPALSNWAWINQGTATATDQGTGSTGIVLKDATHSGNSLAILKRAAPGSTPYTITAGIIPQGIDRDFCSLGVCFRKSGSGELNCIGLLRNTTYNLRVYNHSSPTSSGSVQSSINPQGESFAGAPMIYLRLVDNGTNLVFSYSTNGYSFSQLHSMARGSPAPDEVGFFVDSNGTTLDIALALVSWLVE